MAANATPAAALASESRASLWRTALLLGLAALLLFCAGNNGHSLWDRDEPRFAAASRAMLASGDWVVPTFNGEIRYDKPVLIYWLQAGAMRLLGPTTAAARLPAGVAGALVVLLTCLLAHELGASRAGARLAGLIMLTALLPLASFKASTTDGVLTLTVVAALHLHVAQQRRGFAWWRLVLFAATLAASALLKGPPGPMIVGFATLGPALWQRWRPLANPAAAAARAGGKPRPPLALRGLVGLAVFVACGLPWVAAVTQNTGGEFLRVAFGRHVVERSARALEGHGGPFFYYLPVLWLDLFPFGTLLLLALRWAWGTLRNRETAPATRQALRLLACWVLPALLVFSLVKTKLPHYLLPLLPALATVCGLAWPTLTESTAASRWPRWRATGAALLALCGLALAVAAPLAIAQAKLGAAVLWPGSLGAGLCGLAAVVGSLEWWRGHARVALRCWLAGQAALVLIALGWLLPALEPLRPSRPLAEWVRCQGPPGTQLLAVDYKEPSLVFYWGRAVEMLGHRDAHQAMARLNDASRPAALVIPRPRWEEWQRKYPQARPGPGVAPRYAGRFYLFTRGEWRELLIVTNFPPTPASGA